MVNFQRVVRGSRGAAESGALVGESAADGVAGGSKDAGGSMRRADCWSAMEESEAVAGEASGAVAALSCGRTGGKKARPAQRYHGGSERACGSAAL